jgi:hypothetical protein
MPTVAVASASAPADADRCPIKYVLTITDEGDSKLHFSIRPDPSGVFRDYVRDIPPRGVREAYVSGLYEAIADRYRTAGGDAQAFQNPFRNSATSCASNCSQRTCRRCSGSIAARSKGCSCCLENRSFRGSSFT